MEKVSELKDCPYCSEEIKITAKKCKHCGEFLDDELKKLNLKSSQSNEVNYSKSPGLAILLSLMFPGAGQYYTGAIFIGLLWTLFVFGLYIFFLPIGFLLHIACVLDSVRAVGEYRSNQEAKLKSAMK